LRFPGFRLVKAGEQLAVRDYTADIPWRPSGFTGTADVDRVLAEWERGATIVLQGLHLHVPQLGAFCRSLERTLGHPAQVNAYYTPRAAQGLPVHHDTHDVFVLQVSGEKRWLVYEPALELPLRNQKYSSEMGGPGEPVHDLVLRAGDMLYLPRGWLHEALTSDTDSLHLTVGVNVVTWLEAFKAALDECGGELGFRRSIGAGDAEELVEALRGRLTADAVERRAAEKLARTRRPIRDGQLSQLRALEDLDVDTELERRETALVYSSERDGSMTLTFDGKDVAFPARIRDEVSWVLERDDAFTAADLPGDLDDESRVVLVRRLIREGLLRISAA
jgi:Cupin superfamily protein